MAKAPPIKPDKSRERRYALYLLALLGYITRHAKETGINDTDTPATDKLKLFEWIQKAHEDRLKKAPYTLDTVFSEASTAASSRFDRAVQSIVKEEAQVPLSFDTQYALNDALAASIAENLSLVRGLSQGYIDKLQAAVLRYHQTGEGSLSQELQKITNVSKNRAKLIARDQLNKLHGEVVKIKAMAIGSIGYQWHNMQDERVRGNPNGIYPSVPREKDHWILEGRYFLWVPMINPPPAPDGKPFNQPPADLFPGYAINCRCYSSPVINFS